jgi:hypothetical protein
MGESLSRGKFFSALQAMIGMAVSFVVRVASSIDQTDISNLRFEISK